MAEMQIISGWTEQLEALRQRVGSHFARAEPRRRVRTYLEGLLGGAERRNGWLTAFNSRVLREIRCASHHPKPSTRV